MTTRLINGNVPKPFEKVYVGSLKNGAFFILDDSVFLKTSEGPTHVAYFDFVRAQSLSMEKETFVEPLDAEITWWRKK